MDLSPIEGNIPKTSSEVPETPPLLEIPETPNVWETSPLELPEVGKNLASLWVQPTLC